MRFRPLDGQGLAGAPPLNSQWAAVPSLEAPPPLSLVDMNLINPLDELKKFYTERATKLRTTGGRLNIRCDRSRLETEPLHRSVARGSGKMWLAILGSPRLRLSDLGYMPPPLQGFCTQ